MYFNLQTWQKIVSSAPSDWKAISDLAFAAKTDNVQDIFVITGGAENLVKFLCLTVLDENNSSSLERRDQAARALSNFVGIQDFVEMVLKVDAFIAHKLFAMLEETLEQFENDSKSSIITIGNILCAIAKFSSSSQRFCEMMLEASEQRISEMLCDFLKNIPDNSVRANACFALAGLLQHCPQQVGMENGSIAIEILVNDQTHILTGNNDEMMMTTNAMWVIGNVARNFPQLPIWQSVTNAPLLLSLCSKMLSSRSKHIHCCGCWNIATLSKCQDTNFGKTMVDTNPKVGLRLASLLASTETKSSSYAILAFSNLVDVVPGFGVEMVALDGALPWKLNNILLSHSSTSAKAKAMQIVANLTLASPEFGIGISNKIDLQNLIELTLLSSDELLVTNGLYAIASLLDRVPAFPSKLVTLTRSVHYKFHHDFLAGLCALLASSPPGTQIIYHISWILSNLVSKIPEIGGELWKVDPAFTGKLWKCLEQSDPHLAGIICAVVATMAENVPDFGRAFNEASRYELGNKLCELLIMYSHTTPQPPEDLVATPTMQADMEETIAKAIACLVADVAAFGEHIVAFWNSSLARKLCNMLNRDKEQVRIQAVAAVANLVSKDPSFGVMLTVADPNLSGKLSYLLQQGISDEMTQSYVAWTVGCLIEQVSGFANDLVNVDTHITSKLCKMISATSAPGCQSSAAWAVGNLCLVLPHIAQYLVDEDSNLGRNLCDLLGSNSTSTNTNKSFVAFAIAELVDKVAGFGPKLASMDMHLGSKLCNVLFHPSQDAKTKALMAISALCRSVSGFGAMLLTNLATKAVLVKSGSMISMATTTTTTSSSAGLASVTSYAHMLSSSPKSQSERSLLPPPEVSPYHRHHSSSDVARLGRKLMTFLDSASTTLSSTSTSTLTTAALTSTASIVSITAASMIPTAATTATATIEETRVQNMRNSALIIGYLVAEVPEYSKTLLSIDSSLAAKLITMLSSPSPKTAGTAAWAIASLVSAAAPNFGNAILNLDREVASKLLHLICTDADHGLTRNFATLAMASMCLNVDGFGDKMFAVDPALLNSKLCSFLQDKVEQSNTIEESVDNDDDDEEEAAQGSIHNYNDIKGTAAGAIAILASRVHNFAEILLAEEETFTVVATSLCKNLSVNSSNSEITRSNSAWAISILTCRNPQFGTKVVELDPALPSSLSALLTTDEDPIPLAKAADCIASLSSCTSGFITALMEQDSQIGSKLSDLLTNDIVDVRIAGSKALGVMLQQSSNFASYICKMDEPVGIKLCMLLPLLEGDATPQQQEDLACLPHPLIAICILLETDPNFGKSVAFDAELKLNAKLCSLLALAPDDRSKAFCAKIIRKLTASIPDYGKSISDFDPKLSQKLCALLASEDVGVRYDATVAIVIMVNAVRGFGKFMKASFSKLGQQLCGDLAGDHGDESRKLHAISAIATLMQNMKSFAVSLMDCDPQIGVKLCQVVSEEETLDENTRGSAAVSLSVMVKNIKDFGISLGETVAFQLGSNLVHMLEKTSDDKTVAIAADTFANLVQFVPKFGDEMHQRHPTLESTLSRLLSDSNIPVMVAIARMVGTVEPFGIETIAMSSQNQQVFAKLLGENDDDLKYNVIHTIALLMQRLDQEKRASYCASWMGESDIAALLGSKLCSLLTNSLLPINFDAVYVVSKFAEHGFAEKIVTSTSDSAVAAAATSMLPASLCRLLMVHADEVQKGRVVEAIANLVEQVPSFGASLVHLSHPTAQQHHPPQKKSATNVTVSGGIVKLTSFLSSSVEATKVQSIRALECMLKSTESFAAVIASSDSKLGMKLCDLIVQVEDDKLKCSISWILATLISKVPTFAGTALVGNSINNLVLMLDSSKAQQVRSSVAQVIANITQVANGDALIMGACHNEATKTIFWNLIKTDMDLGLTVMLHLVGNYARELIKDEIGKNAAVLLAGAISSPLSDSSASMALDTISRLVVKDEAFEFRNALVNCDEQLEHKLCKAMSDESIKEQAVLIMSVLVEKVFKFSQRLVSGFPPEVFTSSIVPLILRLSKDKDKDDACSFYALKAVAALLSHHPTYTVTLTGAIQQPMVFASSLCALLGAAGSPEGSDVLALQILVYLIDNVPDFDSMNSLGKLEIGTEKIKLLLTHPKSDEAKSNAAWIVSRMALKYGKNNPIQVDTDLCQKLVNLLKIDKAQSTGARALGLLVGSLSKSESHRLKHLSPADLGLTALCDICCSGEDKDLPTKGNAALAIACLIGKYRNKVVLTSTPVLLSKLLSLFTVTSSDDRETRTSLAWAIGAVLVQYYDHEDATELVKSPVMTEFDEKPLLYSTLVELLSHPVDSAKHFAAPLGIIQLIRMKAVQPILIERDGAVQATLARHLLLPLLKDASQQQHSGDDEQEREQEDNRDLCIGLLAIADGIQLIPGFANKLLECDATAIPVRLCQCFSHTDGSVSRSAALTISRFLQQVGDFGYTISNADDSIGEKLFAQVLNANMSGNLKHLEIAQVALVELIERIPSTREICAKVFGRKIEVTKVYQLVLDDERRSGPDQQHYMIRAMAKLMEKVREFEISLINFAETNHGFGTTMCDMVTDRKNGSEEHAAFILSKLFEKIPEYGQNLVTSNTSLIARLCNLIEDAAGTNFAKHERIRANAAMAIANLAAFGDTKFNSFTLAAVPEVIPSLSHVFSKTQISQSLSNSLLAVAKIMEKSSPFSRALCKEEPDLPTKLGQWINQVTGDEYSLMANATLCVRILCRNVSGFKDMAKIVLKPELHVSVFGVESTAS